jgi:hypothetical protein
MINLEKATIQYRCLQHRLAYHLEVRVGMDFLTDLVELCVLEQDIQETLNLVRFPSRKYYELLEKVQVLKEECRPAEPEPDIRDYLEDIKEGMSMSFFGRMPACAAEEQYLQEELAKIC